MKVSGIHKIRKNTILVRLHSDKRVFAIVQNQWTFKIQYY